MRFTKKHSPNEDNNFWLSATDMMAGILTIVLLLLMLFVLYLNQSRDDVFTILDATEYPSGQQQEKERDIRLETAYINTDGEDFTLPTMNENQQGGGGTTAPSAAPTQAPTNPPTEKKGDVEGNDKAAVFVTVVDAETGNTIKKKGISFELYAEKNGTGGLQMLYTYYPQKVEYRKYETNEEGAFYLPEKINAGWYSLHNVVAPDGYYVEGNTDFQISDYWTWSEPYMVTVSMKQIKKTIRVLAEAAETAEPIEGAIYEIYAKKDIVSGDGTVRYSAGTTVDKIVTDSKGEGESRMLNLGTYAVRQSYAPDYYAVNLKESLATVSGAAGGESDYIRMKCQKTTVNIRLIDERTQDPIPGAIYTTKDRDDFLTDSNGMFTLTKLRKSTTYSYTLAYLPGDYQKKSRKISFTVDSFGLVNEQPVANISDIAYLICLDVEVRDTILGRSASGVDLVLETEDGEIVKDWTSGDAPIQLTGLTPGKYYLKRAGDSDAKVTVEVTNSSKIHRAAMRIWGTTDTFVLLMAAGVIVLAVLISGMIIKRRKKAKKPHE